jgi:hypothetical protein
MDQPTVQPIELFMRFCSDANIDMKLIGDCLGKYILAYQRNISHRAAFDVLYGVGRQTKAYMNWDFLERQLTKIENPGHWLYLFRFIDFTVVPRQHKRMLEDTERHLSSLGIPNTVDISCQLFILKNTNFISARKGVSSLFVQHEIHNPDEKAMNFFSLVADSAFDMNETTATFCHIMNTCRFKISEMDEQIQFLNLRNEVRNRSLQPYQTRPLPLFLFYNASPCFVHIESRKQETLIYENRMLAFSNTVKVWFGCVY